MLSFLFCIIAFAITASLARRSLVAGVSAVMTVGYFYGITRANALGSFSHFIFDASVLGLYSSLTFKVITGKHKQRVERLQAWVFVAFLWPTLVFLIPVQDSLIRLVGLRG